MLAMTIGQRYLTIVLFLQNQERLEINFSTILCVLQYELSIIVNIKLSYE